MRASHKERPDPFLSLDGWKLLGEYDADGQALQETIWLGDLPVVTVQTGVSYYIQPDHLGTPRVIEDQSGRTVWRWDSELFGSDEANEDPDGDGVRLGYGLRFAGQYYDGETGLHYNYFRHYDPSTGRYIQSDPIGLRGGLNSYTYALGNPVFYFDPFGLSACSDLVQALIERWSATHSSRELGMQMLDRRYTTLRTTDGFRPELVAGGQGGAVSRHIYGHAGATLAYGYGASYANQAIDYLQRYQRGRTVEESRAEIADDRAGRNVADSLYWAMEARRRNERASHQCVDTSDMEADLRNTLEGLLCGE